MEAVGLEPMTSCMSSKRSNQLSYVSKALSYYHIFNIFTSDLQSFLCFKFSKILEINGKWWYNSIIKKQRGFYYVER